MSEPTRFMCFGREHPGPGSRVEGIPGSASLGGRRGLITRRDPKNASCVIVQFDCWPGRTLSVVISLLRDEPVLDQLARIDPNG